MSDVRDIQWTTYGETDLEPLALVVTLAMTALAFRAKRAQTILPLLVVFAMIAHSQRIVLLDLDFSMQRIIVLAVLGRIAASGDIRKLRITNLDRAFFTWVAAFIVIGIIGSPSTSTLINRLGYAVDSWGAYLVVRSCVQNQNDVTIALRALAWVLIPIAVMMSFENMTGRNLFSFTGAPEFATIREGRVRCQGALGHPILAGSFGAISVPLMIGLALSNKGSRTLAGFGIVSGFLITLASASSGAVICFAAGLGAWFLWFLRRWTRLILYGAVALTVVIHFIREQPVWHLIGRLSELIGGTGYHRVKLIDAAVQHFGEWWLIGTKNSKYWGWGLQDTTNWYISNGLHGGLVTLIAFIAMIVLTFRAVRAARITAARMKSRGMPGGLALEYIAWGLGASMVANCFSWISVAYYGTIELIFFFQLALFSALKPNLKNGVRSRSRQGRTAKKGTSDGPTQIGPSPSLSGLLSRPDEH